MAGSGIYLPTAELHRGMATLPAKVNAGLYALTEYNAPQVQAHARTNAPWRDQTSNARNGLTAVAEHDTLSHAITLFHQMPYGIWLEVRWGGRYAIILPTIREFGPKVMQQARDMLGRL